MELGASRDATHRQRGERRKTWNRLPKMLSGANAFEISDIERMNIGAHQPGI